MSQLCTTVTSWVLSKFVLSATDALWTGHKVIHFVPVQRLNVVITSCACSSSVLLWILSNRPKWYKCSTNYKTMSMMWQNKCMLSLPALKFWNIQTEIMHISSGGCNNPVSAKFAHFLVLKTCYLAPLGHISPTMWSVRIPLSSQPPPLCQICLRIMVALLTAKLWWGQSIWKWKHELLSCYHYLRSISITERTSLCYAWLVSHESVLAECCLSSTVVCLFGTWELRLNGAR